MLKGQRKGEYLTVADYLARSTREGDCLIWGGKVTKRGTLDESGVLRVERNPDKYMSARRAVWAHGGRPPLPDDQFLSPTCGRTLCVELTHLVLKSRDDLASAQVLEICRAGLHDLTIATNRAANGGGYLICRVCKLERQKEWRRARDTRRLLDQLS